jgi:hypothetical protein
MNLAFPDASSKDGRSLCGRVGSKVSGASPAQHLYVEVPGPDAYLFSTLGDSPVDDIDISNR